MKPIEIERTEKKRTRMQQLEVDVRIYGVIFDILDKSGKRRIGIIRKGQPIPDSINELNVPNYRRLSRAERKAFTKKTTTKLEGVTNPPALFPEDPKLEWIDTSSSAK